MADEYLTIDGHKLDDVEDISKQKGTPLITDLVLVVELNDDGKTVSKAKYYSVDDLIKSLGSDVTAVKTQVQELSQAAEDAKDDAVAAKNFVENAIGDLGYLLPEPQVEFIPDPDGDRGIVKLLAGYDELGTVQVQMALDSDSEEIVLLDFDGKEVLSNGTYHVTAKQNNSEYPLGTSVTVPLVVSGLKTQKPAAVYSGASARAITAPDLDSFPGIFIVSLRNGEDASSAAFVCQYEAGTYSLSNNATLSQKKLNLVIEPNTYQFNSTDDTVYMCILAAVHGSGKYLVISNRGVSTAQSGVFYYPPVTIPDMLLTGSQIDFAVMISSSPIDADPYEFVTIPTGVSTRSVIIADSIKTTASSGETVELIPLSEDAQINYSIDDPDAWMSDADQYTSPIAVTSSQMTIRAVSVRVGIAVSDMTTLAIGYSIDPPELMMQAGATSDTCKVIVINSDDYEETDTLRYTDDGTSPSETSAEVPDGGITVTENCTIKVKIFGSTGSAESSIAISSLKVQKPAITLIEEE